MPFIVIVIQLCATGWCASADYIVTAKDKDACEAWIKTEYQAYQTNGRIVSCSPMPGWQNAETSR